MMSPEFPGSPFTHQVRCDFARWARSRQVYWIVLSALWDHADSFQLQDYGGESVLPSLIALPGVKPVPDWVNAVAGPTSHAARALLIRPGGAVWFSLSLFKHGQPIFYDEDGGDTMLFAAQGDTLERIAAQGVTEHDLIVLLRGQR
jgi:hypothetical protein